jgi:hypothetical protein
MSVNAIIRYFDLQSAKREIIAKAQAVGDNPPAPVFPQYVALALGIVIQPYLAYYTQHGAWSLTFADVLARLAFGIIVAAMGFPGVYKRAFDPDKPLFVQLCAIFTAGIGWQSLIQGGAKAILGIP